MVGGRRTMTDREKWLMSLAIQCVNWGEGDDFEFHEILRENDIMKYYPGEYEPYPDNEFCNFSDEEYEVASDEQKDLWDAEVDAKENTWLDSREIIIEKVREEITALLQKLRDERWPEK
jgi:hypothetical protein